MIFSSMSNVDTMSTKSNFNKLSVNEQIAVLKQDAANVAKDSKFITLGCEIQNKIDRDYADKLCIKLLSESTPEQEAMEYLMKLIYICKSNNIPYYKVLMKVCTFKCIPKVLANIDLFISKYILCKPMEDPKKIEQKVETTSEQQKQVKQGSAAKQIDSFIDGEYKEIKSTPVNEKGNKQNKGKQVKQGNVAHPLYNIPNGNGINNYPNTNVNGANIVNAFVNQQQPSVANQVVQQNINNAIQQTVPDYYASDAYKKIEADVKKAISFKRKTVTKQQIYNLHYMMSSEYFNNKTKELMIVKAKNCLLYELKDFDKYDKQRFNIVLGANSAVSGKKIIILYNMNTRECCIFNADAGLVR